MIGLPPKPIFAPPATHFLASSPELPRGAAAVAALFGAPLDLTESFRSGAHAGPSAVRFISDALETLRFLFEADAPPGAPYPSCGADPTTDGLGCENRDPPCL